MSRDLTIRSPQGTLQHILVPREATIIAPLGERGLSGIRRGMMVHVLDDESSGNVIAHGIVAHTKTGGEWRGWSAVHQPSH